MGKLVSCAKQQCDLNAKCDFDQFNCVQEQRAKSLIEEIQIDDLFKGCSKLKIIQDNHARSSGCWINLDLSLAEWIGIAREPIVANSLQPL